MHTIGQIACSSKRFLQACRCQQRLDTDFLGVQRQIKLRLFAPQVDGSVGYMAALIHGQLIVFYFCYTVTHGDETVAVFHEQILISSLLKLHGACKINVTPLSIGMVRRSNQSAALLSGHGQNRSQRHICHTPLEIVRSVKPDSSCSMQGAIAC